MPMFTFDTSRVSPFILSLLVIGFILIELAVTALVIAKTIRTL